MTSRERFIQTMTFGVTDRPPLFEEGFREEVLDRWREQGMPEGSAITDLFHYDRRERLPVNVEPIPPMEQPPRTLADVAELERRLDPDDPARFPSDWPKRLRGWQTREHVLDLYISRGFYLACGVHDWRGFEQLMYLMADAPDLVRKTMEIAACFNARLAERVLRQVEVDYVTFSEPIGGAAAPLISPGDYRRFALSSYEPVLDAVRAHGVQVICFMTYSNVAPLLSDVVAAGFNCLWACETGPGTMDYRVLRRRFGPALRLIGGIDLDLLLLDEDAIRRQLEVLVPTLLRQGGYIPLADGRVRPNIPFESYCIYRRLLEGFVDV